MKITAEDLKKLKIIDKIIQEPEGGAQNNLEQVSNDLKKYINDSIIKLKQIPKEKLIEQRYEKFRKM